MTKIYRVIQINIESFSLRKFPYDQWLTNKAYLSAIAVTNFSEILPTTWRQKLSGTDMEQNKITLCIAALVAWTKLYPRRARLVPGWVTVFGRVYHLGM